MTVTTYTSASKGVLTITEMPTPHIENAIRKIGLNEAEAARQADLLAALTAELETREDRTA